MFGELSKKIYLVFGFIFMGIGIAGYVLPVLPGTIFMIIAAYCFLNSSEKLYKRIVNHPSYGKSIKDFIEKNKIPRSSKSIILLSMWMATIFSVIILNPTIALKVLAIFLAMIGTIVVLRTSD
tara:strand:- start:74 stop:442 length:369 start_codon:yes stop_codon:yes gene_type:complete